MTTFWHTALFLIGFVMVIIAVSAAVRSTVLPRAVAVRTTQWIALMVRIVFRLRAGRSPSYLRRDKIMALFGPVTLLTLLLSWLLEVGVGYTLIYLALTKRGLSGAIELSGSSIFTLGTTSDTHFVPSLLTYSEAGIGLLLLTLLITYLPSIYGAFSRRESAVTALAVRAGSPPSAVEMLIRLHLIDNPQSRLADMWQNWEVWFVDIEESHTSFSILAFFRSPLPEQSWVVAAGTVLDAAALWISSLEHPRDPDAQLCLRAGYICLRRIAGIFGISFNAEPTATDPITISRAEFDDAYDQMNAAGLSVLADRDQAWLNFAGWRVNYDTVLLNLARLTEAPPAPWTSDRSPLRANETWTLKGQVANRVLGSTRAKQHRR